MEKYTSDEIQQIKKDLADGLSNKEITGKLDRTRKGLQSFVVKSGLNVLRKRSKVLRNKEFYSRYLQGVKVRDIAIQYNVCRKTVHNAIKKERGNNETK